MLLPPLPSSHLNQDFSCLSVCILNYFVCVWLFSLHVCLCTYVPSLHGCQRERQIPWSYRWCESAGNWTCDLSLTLWMGLFCIETRSHVAQAGLQLTLYVRLALNPWSLSSTFSLPKCVPVLWSIGIRTQGFVHPCQALYHLSFTLQSCVHFYCPWTA